MKKVLKNKFLVVLTLCFLAFTTIFSVLTILYSRDTAYAFEEENINSMDESRSLKHDSTLIENSRKTLSIVRSYSMCTNALQDFSMASLAVINFKLDEVSVILTKASSKEEIDEDIFLNINNIEKVDEIKTPTRANLNNNLYRQILTIKLQNGGVENIFAIIDELQNLEEVLVAEPKYVFTPHDDFMPNDPLYNSETQWGLSGNNGIEIENAWDINNGFISQDKIKVGVFESGIQLAHPDLIVGTGNLIANNNANLDHGTHVAGIIGARTNNNIGIAGIAPTETYVLDRTNLKSSLEWAEENGIKVVNASFYNSRPLLDNNGIVIQEAVYNATDAQAIANFGGLFVTSAGNQNLDNNLHPQYPAGYRLPNVIVVGSISSNGNKSYFSNYGSQTVDIFAPGDYILSTFPIDKCNSNVNETYNTPSGIKRWCEVKWSDEKNQWVSNGTTHVDTGYHFMSGTSMAAPHVTGVAALMMSFNPYLTAEEIKDIIINNDTNLDAVSNSCVSGGILNAYKALKATHKTEEIFTDFGYEGSTYSWKGSVEMDYDADNKMEDGMLIVEDYSSLSFEVKTISSENAWLVTNGEIRFELEQSDGQIIQTNICTVTVDLLNNVTFTGNTFSIDTSQLGTGTYFLKMYCTFNRGEWSSETTHSYAFGVNRPITVMDEFGYLSSWYKWKGNVKLSSDYLYLFNNSNSLTLMGDVDLTFTIGTSFAFNAVQEMTGTVTIELQDSSGNIIPINGNNKHTSNIRVGLASNVSISNSSFTINISDFADDTYTLRLDCRMTRGSTTYNNSDTYSFSVRNETCIAQGTMITLADGTQKAVEDLTGDEQLLVWNMLTGQFDTAPILFIDSDEQRFYQVVNLYFSDGTSVKVIGEHAFWNKDLNEYVFLRKDADQYIGDSFIKQTTNDNGEMVSSEVLLIDVVVTMEHTTAWSPVTYGHLCYYVNGMLSMPGATEGLINIFEVDPDTMRYDEEAMNQDIAIYGLFTYEEFNALIPVPEEIFEAFSGQYLKVSIGKGYTSIEELAQLIERYSQFF